MDLKKTITYEELLSMSHFIELDGHVINSQYYNMWATKVTIPEGKNCGINATYGIYFIYPNTESYINKASPPIISYGKQNAGVTGIMIYDTENNKYINADVTYRNNWDKPLFVPTKLQESLEDILNMCKLRI